MMEPNGLGITGSLEAQLASELQALLSGVPVGSEFTVAPSSDFSYSLELFIPRVLRHHHSEWAKESLDGIFVARARKTGSVAAELAGTCILMSDQAVTPFLIALALSPLGKSIQLLQVCIGEPGGGSLGISGPDCNSREAKNLLADISTRLGSIAWSYRIAVDESGTVRPIY